MKKQMVLFTLLLSAVSQLNAHIYHGDNPALNHVFRQEDSPCINLIGNNPAASCGPAFFNKDQTAYFRGQKVTISKGAFTVSESRITYKDYSLTSTNDGLIAYYDDYDLALTALLFFVMDKKNTKAIKKILKSTKSKMSFKKLLAYLKDETNDMDLKRMIARYRTLLKIEAHGEGYSQAKVHITDESIIKDYRDILQKEKEAKNAFDAQRNALDAQRKKFNTGIPKRRLDLLTYIILPNDSPKKMIGVYPGYEGYSETRAQPIKK